MSWRPLNGALPTGRPAVIALIILTGCGFQLKGTGSNNTQLRGLTIRLISSQLAPNSLGKSRSN